MPRKFWKSCLSLVCLGIFVSLIVGCELLTPYQAPLTPTPHEWKTTVEENEINADHWKQEEKEPSYKELQGDLCTWWEIFNDSILNQLEEHALQSSYTLWAALERVIEARAQARINFSPLLPSIYFAPSFTRSGSLFQNPFANLANGGNAPCSLSGLRKDAFQAMQTNNNIGATEVNAPDFRFVQSQYLVPLTFQYEVDLWGKLNNTFYASVMRAQSASQAYLSVLLSLTADVASTYFQIRSLDTQQKVIQHNILLRKNALDITQARYDAGIIVYLDVSRSQVELAKAYADSAEVYRLRGLQENMLATLIGVPASVFALEYSPLQEPPPQIPVGLPSELLSRRPDILEAERDLAAAYKDIGVAYAGFFPSLNLNASYGFESPFGFQLFNWRSRFWEIGFDILQTVFDAGRTEANYDYYRARFSEAMANYQKTVLNAFQDVEDSLVNIRWYARRNIDFSAAVDSAKTTFNLANMRYTRGLVTYLEVIDAEQQLLETEQNVATTLGNRYVSTVALIRALGGGWEASSICQDDWGVSSIVDETP